MDGPARLATLESIKSMTSAMNTTVRTSHALRSGSVLVVGAWDRR